MSDIERNATWDLMLGEESTTKIITSTYERAGFDPKTHFLQINFHRIDYPEVDPPAWNKYVTVKMENGKVKSGDLPLFYWGDMKANYEAHNRDYTGVHERK
jgi:hypothetical protein